MVYFVIFFINLIIVLGFFVNIVCQRFMFMFEVIQVYEILYVNLFLMLVKLQVSSVCKNLKLYLLSVLKYLVFLEFQVQIIILLVDLGIFQVEIVCNMLSSKDICKWFCDDLDFIFKKMKLEFNLGEDDEDKDLELGLLGILKVLVQIFGQLDMDIIVEFLQFLLMFDNVVNLVFISMVYLFEVMLVFFQVIYIFVELVGMEVQIKYLVWFMVIQMIVVGLGLGVEQIKQCKEEFKEEKVVKIESVLIKWCLLVQG